MLAALFDLFFPPACAACDSRLRASAPGPFCTLCAESLEPLVPPFCTVCGEPFGGEGPSHPCLRCLRKPPPFDLLRAPYVYGGALREAIHRYKYGGAWDLGRHLAPLLARGGPGLDPRSFDVVVPVPLHPRRLAERGFDQAVPLARAVARESGLPLRPRALRRLRATAPQAALVGEARRANVRGAFAVSRPSEVAARRVLLVDDVVTTGATARACAAALREAGAKGVGVLSLARTGP
jgi:ComF family protein